MAFCAANPAIDRRRQKKKAAALPPSFQVLAIAPAAVPAFAMGPIAVAIPIAAAGIEIADYQRADGNADSRTVGTAMAIGTAMEARAATLGRLGSWGQGSKNATGGKRSKDQFFYRFSPV